MTDYLNPHKIYPDDISRRIDIAPGFDSVRDVNYTHETGATGATVKDSLTTEVLRDVDGEIVGFWKEEESK